VEGYSVLAAQLDRFIIGYSNARQQPSHSIWAVEWLDGRTIFSVPWTSTAKRPIKSPQSATPALEYLTAIFPQKFLVY
jgi:hypothetical protein